MSAVAQPVPELSVDGQYAGVATRSFAFAVDCVSIAATFALGSAVVERLLALFLGRDVRLSDSQLASTIALVMWAFVYCAYPLAVTGRTFGMAILGLRAVRSDGSDLSAGRATARVIVFPVSLLLIGLGLILIVARRDHRALHDLIAGTALVYDWQAGAGRTRFLTRGPPIRDNALAATHAADERSY
jgi:uncharacterized RDD family membrane protein YckC